MILHLVYVIQKNETEGWKTQISVQLGKFLSSNHHQLLEEKKTLENSSLESSSTRKDFSSVQAVSTKE